MMITLKFSTGINAPAAKVWHCLWDSTSYTKWTSVFHEGSYAVSDWKQGSRVHFLAPSGEGMFSHIDINEPSSKMYFRHLGVVRDFIEQPEDAASKLWSGAMEKYDLEETDGKTILNVSVDTMEKHAEYFRNTFPKALEMVKQSAEEVQITLHTTVNCTLEQAWNFWTLPEHIVKWNQASPDWHTTSSENNLYAGGTFSARMEAKDGSFGFDFSGVYDEVITHELIAYTLLDGRTVKVQFKGTDGQTTITESFEPESENAVEMQIAGWTAILDSFKSYAEANS